MSRREHPGDSNSVQYLLSSFCSLRSKTDSRDFNRRERAQSFLHKSSPRRLVGVADTGNDSYGRPVSIASKAPEILSRSNLLESKLFTFLKNVHEC